MLTQIFSSSSRARVTELRCQLQTAVKGSLSYTDYLKNLRHIADELRFASQPLSDDDLIPAVLSGLRPEYNPFVITVNMSSRLSPISFPEVHSFLIAHENLLQRQSVLPSLPSIDSPSAYVVRSGQRPPYNPRPGYYNPDSRPTAPPQYRPNYQNQVRPNNQFQFRPNQPTSFAPHQNKPWTLNQNFDPNSKQTEAKPQCQICAKFGHTAKICYFRYNADKANSQSPSTYHAYVAQSTV